MHPFRSRLELQNDFLATPGLEAAFSAPRWTLPRRDIVEAQLAAMMKEEILRLGLLGRGEKLDGYFSILAPFMAGTRVPFPNLFLATSRGASRKISPDEMPSLLERTTRILVNAPTESYFAPEDALSASFFASVGWRSLSCHKRLSCLEARQGRKPVS